MPQEEEIPDDSHGRAISVSIQELVIERLNNELEQILMSITLDELRKRYQDLREYDQDMYYI